MKFYMTMSNNIRHKQMASKYAEIPYSLNLAFIKLNGMLKSVIYQLALSGVPLLFCSCGFLMGSPSEYEIQKDVPIKWLGEDSGISNLLDIDGYFCLSSYLGDSCVSPCVDNITEHRGMAFFADGTYVQFISTKRGKNQVEHISISESGIYTLRHDTIIAEIFISDRKKIRIGKKKRFPVLKRIKILDRHTIEEIDAYNPYKNEYRNKALIRSFGKYIDDIPTCDRTIGSFSDNYKFPTSDIKIKEKLWLWKNSYDWRMWMELQLEKENSRIKKTYIIKYDD